MAVSRREPHEGGIFFIFLYIILQTAYIGKVTACLETLQNITCTCTNNSVTCTGTSYENAFGDIVSAVSNLSSNYTHGGIESINITISEFSLNSNASFENVIAENLTLGSGLTSLPENLFHGLNESLANLNLQNNKLSSVPTNALNILAQLKELDLSNNEIKNLKSDDFRGMPLLIFLNLNRNNIQTLEDETFSELTNLQVLLLDLNNMLEIEDDAFQGLNDLQMLSIAGNDLQYLAPEPFLHLSSLETLVLNRNELTSFSNINIESSSLKKLSAQYCSLKDPIEEDHFSDLPNLIFVDLSHNNIKEVKTMALSGLHHLESLNLSNNEIKRVNKNAFSGLPSLLKLSLQNNDIEVASRSAFFSLTNLTYLNLDNNKLQALLCEYTADLHSLEEISIQNNRLKTVRAGSLMYSNELKQLRMEGNDLECDCILSSFSNFFHNNNISGSTSAKCSSPPALQGKSVIDVDFDSMMCGNFSFCKSPSLQGSSLSFTPTTDTLLTTESRFYSYAYRIVKRAQSFNNPSTANEDLINPTNNLNNDADSQENNMELNSMLSSSKHLQREKDTPAFIDLQNIVLPFDELSTVTENEGSTTTIASSEQETFSDLSITISSENEPDLSLQGYIENKTESSNQSSITFEIAINTTTMKSIIHLNTLKDNKSTPIESTGSTKQSHTILNVLHTRKHTAEFSSSTTDSSVISNMTSPPTATLAPFTQFDSTILPISNISSKNDSMLSSHVNKTTQKTELPIQYSTSFSIASDSATVKSIFQTSTLYSTDTSSTETTSIPSTDETDTSLPTEMTTKNATTETSLPAIYFTMANENGSDVQSTTNAISKSELHSERQTDITPGTNNLRKGNSSDTTTEVIFSSEDALTLSSETERVTRKLKVSYPDKPFHFTHLSISEKRSNFAFIEWKVIRDEPYSVCTLILQIFPNNTTFEETRFNCSNNSYLVTNTKKQMIYKICLTSNHSLYGNFVMCEHISLHCNERSASQISQTPRITLYAILLGFLIAVVSTIVLLIVAKSIHCKRVMPNSYNASKIKNSLFVKKFSSEFSTNCSSCVTQDRYVYYPNGITDGL